MTSPTGTDGDRGPGTGDRRGRCIAVIAIVLLVLGQAISIWHAEAHYCRADSRGALLVSQAIIQHGTTRLDDYGDAVGDLGYRVVQRDGHSRYYFPLGTSLVAIPAVWVANACGLDMATELDDIHVQKILSGILLGLVTLLVYALSRCYLGRPSSLAIATIFGSCTTLISTIGSALWSHDAAVVCVLLGIYILGNLDSGARRSAVLACLLGCVVVVAWMCRPTATLFGVAAAAFLALTRPRLLLPFGIGIVTVGSAFMGWSWWDSHQVLPDYYLPGRLGGTRRFGEALLGHLISPSRGLFVYSPVLLLTLGGIIRHRRSILRVPLARMSLAWIAAFWLVISRFPHWWGGYCYGSRLLVDTMPAWALLTILVWRQDLLAPSGRAKSLFAGLWVVAGVWGFHVNTTKGLHDLATVGWNERPDIDTHPEFLFDWRYPQFLATEASLGNRELRAWLSGAAPYHVGTVIDLAGDGAVLSGFNAVERDRDSSFRWTQGQSARISFRSSSDQAPGDSLALDLRCAFFGQQHVEIRVNGTVIGAFDGCDFPPIDRTLLVPEAAWLCGQERGCHEIELQMPDARKASGTDHRVLGVALYSLRFNPAR